MSAEDITPSLRAVICLPQEPSDRYGQKRRKVGGRLHHEPDKEVVKRTCCSRSGAMLIIVSHPNRLEPSCSPLALPCAGHS
jgi:hypothetical protein